ncbi:hypothetical protein [Halosimplex halobium]|uniref:hypothetical protein n=1 Tax=Halosimplex halobium TaxID=3396618 RepID=UPI003F553DDC
MTLMLVFPVLGPAPTLGVPPGTTDIALDRDAYIGERVLVFGEVVSTTPLAIKAQANTGEFLYFTVTDIEITVETGDYLNVYGTLMTDRSVAAIDVVHKPSWPYLRTRILSAVAGLIVLGRSVSHWRIDIKNVRIERRQNPTPILVALADRFDRSDPEDA